MRVTLTRRGLFTAVMIFIGGLILLALLRPSKEDQPLAFQILSIESRFGSDPVLFFSMANISGDTIQYQCADGTNVQPRCEFVLTTRSRETNWFSAPSKSSRFLSPGAKITMNIPVPSEGDLRLGIMARRLPHIQWIDNSLIRRFRSALFVIRANIAARQEYSTYWIPDTIQPGLR